MTYAKSFLRALSAFSLWMCSIRMRLFLKTLPLAFKYKLWYLEKLKKKKIQLNQYLNYSGILNIVMNTFTCADQFSLTPGSDEEDDAGFSCAASMSIFLAYEHWLYPSSYLSSSKFAKRKCWLFLKSNTKKQQLSSGIINCDELYDRQLKKWIYVWRRYYEMKNLP